MGYAFQLGTAEVDVTPPLGLELSGYGYFLERRADGVDAPLIAQALFMEDGTGRKAVLFSADLIGFAREFTGRVRTAVSAATGAPPEAIALCASHTHSGPATIFLHGCGEVDPAYLEWLERRLVEAAVRAAQNARPVTLSMAHASLPGIAYNRTRSGGPVDDLLQCLFVETGGEKPAAVVCRFSCHPVVLRGNNKKVSPDFVGDFRSACMALWPGVKAVYLQGACGDLDPVVGGEERPARMRSIGRELAECLARLWPERVPVRDPEIEGALGTLALPFAELGDEPHEFARKADRLGPAYARFAQESSAVLIRKIAEGTLPAEDLVEAQKIRIGDVVLYFHGAELFSKPAIQLRERLGDRLWVVGYSNDFIGYVPDREDYEAGGYAAVNVPYMVHKPPYLPDVADRWVEKSARFLSGR